MSEERKELTAEELAALGIQRGSDALLRKLHEPFPAAVIGWKPQSVKGNRALAIAYIDVRDVMERLDDVVGPASWEDDYKLISAPNEKPSFLCRLRIRLGERWISKRDVGGCSDQPDAGDRIKSACSDALKRTAVKFGIGRYLYRLSNNWADYDPNKKQFVRPPVLPLWALPANERRNLATTNSQLRDGRPRPVVSGIPRLTSQEAAEIAELISRTGTDGNAFLKHYDIPRVEDLPQKHYADAVKRLTAKIPAGSA
jgi:hypothetical protein